MSQSFRRKGLAEFGDAIRWLTPEPARNSYEYALQYDNKERYGLNPTTVRAIERHKIESINVACHWVRARIPDSGSVRIVFGAEDVFVADTHFFVEAWPNLFAPGRDDVLVLADDKGWILFFPHDNEIGYGHHRDLRRQ